MVRSRVSKRYARALFEFVEEGEQLEIVEKDLSELKKNYETSDEFLTLLESPVIHTSEKKRVFGDLFRKKFHTKTLNFLDLLLDKNREALLPQIIEDFLMLLDEKKGVIRGQLFTAYPFHDNQLKSLKTRLDKITGKNVILVQKVNSDLLGGFIVRMNDTVIDASLKNQLSKMWESLVSAEKRNE